jgi:hypothetical protein
MFRLALPAFAVLICALPAHAQEPKTCDPTTMDCSPLTVCVEATGEVMKGASFGRDEGPFEVSSSDGAMCSGTWWRSVMGLGLAKFTCSDGRSGSSAFTWFEPETGTAVGSGKFSDGSVGKFWAGNNLDRYFREMPANEVQKLDCPVADLLIS